MSELTLELLKFAVIAATTILAWYFKNKNSRLENVLKTIFILGKNPKITEEQFQQAIDALKAELWPKEEIDIDQEPEI